jgi:hypothetical protein
MVKFLAIASSLVMLCGVISPIIVTQAAAIVQKPPTQPQTSGLPIARVRLGKIRPFMLEKEVRQILGTPKRIENENSPAVGKLRSLFYPDITIRLVEDTNKRSFSVYSFSTTSPKYATPDGVRVGDSQDRVIKIYGKTQDERDKQLIVLRYEINLKDIPASLTFAIKGKRVVEISYSEQLN